MTTANLLLAVVVVGRIAVQSPVGFVGVDSLADDCKSASFLSETIFAAHVFAGDIKHEASARIPEITRSRIRLSILLIVGAQSDYQGLSFHPRTNPRPRQMSAAFSG